MNDQNKLENLIFEILEKNCFGCQFDCPSQKDHTCMSAYHYDLAKETATGILQKLIGTNQEHSDLKNGTSDD